MNSDSVAVGRVTNKGVGNVWAKTVFGKVKTVMELLSIEYETLLLARDALASGDLVHDITDGGILRTVNIYPKLLP